MPVPFKVKAVYDYRSEEPDDLNFDNGQVITVVEDDEPDWYTGEYLSTTGDKLEGIFPRNFVEKFEPAVPLRPARAPKKVAQEVTETPTTHPTTHDEPTSNQPSPIEEAHPAPLPREPKSQPEDKPISTPVEAQTAQTAIKPALPSSSQPVKAASTKAPPPVAEKPSSFRDRIAAFNRPAEAPVTPFKPSGPGAPGGFIKKAFVAPPPSKNSYVPPPRETPAAKIYRREEDPELQNEDDREPQAQIPLPVANTDEAQDEDQPKPTSLKERIALLQKQQLEQASRQAEASQKKEKPKKPAKKRTETSEELLDAGQQSEASLERLDTNETLGRQSIDVAEGDSENLPSQRQPVESRGPPPAPPRELVSDTNDADDSGAGDTEDAQETSTEEDRPKPRALPTTAATAAAATEEANDKAEDEDTEEEEDPEVRRKRELRERMAKMSGGMGMMGMFGPPGGLPSAPTKKSKAVPPPESHRDTVESEPTRAPPVPMVAMPGMATMLPKRQEEPAADESEGEETAQPTPQEPLKQTDDYVSQPPKRTSTDRSLPPPPPDRSGPPPPPREIRAAPPPPPGNRPVPVEPQSPTSRPAPPPPPTLPPRDQQPDGDSEDDRDDREDRSANQTSSFPAASAPPVPAIRPPIDAPPIEPSSASSSANRMSRSPPPVPMSPTSPQARPPPPPPPGQPPSRRSTSDSHGITASRHPVDENSDDEVTEYDGDYDTDIASSAKHKDALKSHSHNRDSSIDDGVFTDDAVKGPISPPQRAVPPIPVTGAPRDVPPPPPPTASRARQSTDIPRAAPPPIPPPQAPADEADYDPYRYSAPQHGISSPPTLPSRFPHAQSPREEYEEQDMYGASSAPRMAPLPPLEGPAPPSPPQMFSGGPPPSSFPAAPPPELPRQSLDAKRISMPARRSVDQSQQSSEHGFIAGNIDLGHSSQWWTQENLPPPSLYNRSDILFEMETSSSTKRGGRSSVSKDIYVLYMDYSQSTITAAFDPTDPTHAQLEQSHQRPPPPPRKDQLENASEAFGAQIARTASNYANSSGVVADGSAQGFVLDLLRPLQGALPPVGTRAYGALVYANLANASTQQFDEIRPGDIITFRNAKFAGHKGGLHAKYSMDVGKPEHVGVVIDWDGTKKKIRAWEQGREEKGKKTKVKEESFRVGDLKSGEVRVWRVMPRSWVGWDKS